MVVVDLGVVVKEVVVRVEVVAMVLEVEMVVVVVVGWFLLPIVVAGSCWLVVIEVEVVVVVVGCYCLWLLLVVVGSSSGGGGGGWLLLSMVVAGGCWLVVVEVEVEGAVRRIMVVMGVVGKLVSSILQIEGTAKHLRSMILHVLSIIFIFCLFYLIFFYCSIIVVPIFPCSSPLPCPTPPTMKYLLFIKRKQC